MVAWGQQHRPLVIAHRGASAERPENTIAAFRFAEACGADAIELDVMRCATGEVVVFHDDDLVRLAGRPGTVRSLPLSALRDVRVQGEPIPTLEEVFSATSPSLLINVELKAPEHRGLAHARILRDDGLAAEVARLIERLGVGARVLVSSFHPVLLARFRRAAPSVAIALLFHRDLARPLREAWPARLLRPEALHPERHLVSRRAVERWHRQRRWVHVWTVDDPQEIAFLATIGVDGIITNRPREARALLAGAVAPAASA